RAFEVLNHGLPVANRIAAISNCVAPDGVYGGKALPQVRDGASGCHDVYLVVLAQLFENHSRTGRVPHSFADDSVEDAHRGEPVAPAQRAINSAACGPCPATRRSPIFSSASLPHP